MEKDRNIKQLEDRVEKLEKEMVVLCRDVLKNMIDQMYGVDSKPLKSKQKNQKNWVSRLFGKD